MAEIKAPGRTLTLRLEPQLSDRIDVFAHAKEKEIGMPVKTTAAIRFLLEYALGKTEPGKR